MAGFEFDSTPSPGVNRSASVTDCETCGGDRFVQVVERDEDEHREVYARCPVCNPGTERGPVAPDAWWKQ